jgi:hypothetical protein
VEDPGDVDVDDAAEGRRVDPEDRAVAGDPGVGEDEVDAAERLDSSSYGLLHGLQVAHVREDADRPVGTDRGDDLVEGVLVEVGEDQPHPSFREGGRGGSADAAGSSGDERDQAFEVGAVAGAGTRGAQQHDHTLARRFASPHLGVGALGCPHG